MIHIGIEIYTGIEIHNRRWNDEIHMYAEFFLSETEIEY